MPALLNEWDNLITASINPAFMSRELLTDETTDLIINQSKKESERVRALLIEELVYERRIRDKQQFIQVHQAILIRLLNKLFSYKQVEGLGQKMLRMYTEIGRHLEYVLNFIEDFFSNYFDRNERVPIAYHIISIEELSRQLMLLHQSLEVKSLEPSIIKIIDDSFNEFCFSKENRITYNQLAYQKDLMNELHFHVTLISDFIIREVLFYMNFNNDDYVDFLIRKLISLIEELPTKKEKIAALRLEQKNINQLRTKLNTRLSANMPSLKEQINQWIEEEIKFQQQELIPEPTFIIEGTLEDKIQTSLSVSKLALLLRLMVIDKIITNRVIAHMLRITAKTVSTVQRENIAFGSLETKYHNPDRGTISAVKDMLFRWINVLNKL